MGHKTSIVGFRLGVPVRGELAGRGAYHGFEDIHGHSSRWVAGSKLQHGEWSQRDRVLRRAIAEGLLQDGYLVNKCVISRAPDYVGVYVDGYRVEDRSLITGVHGEERSVEVTRDAAAEAAAEASTAGEGVGGARVKAAEVSSESGAAGGATGVSGVPAENAAEAEGFVGVVSAAEAVAAARSASTAAKAAAAAAGSGAAAPAAVSVDAGAEGRRVLEELLSRHVERGRPVRIQFVALNELLREVPEVHRKALEQAVPRGKYPYAGDLRQVLALLTVVPCAPLVATVISYRLSGGRVQRNVYRLVKALRRVQDKLALKSVSRRGAAAAGLGSVGRRHRGAWRKERLYTREWRQGSLGAATLGREVTVSSLSGESVVASTAVAAAEVASGAAAVAVPGVDAGAGFAVAGSAVSPSGESGASALGQAGYLGYYLCLKGRLAGSERSRKAVLRAGSLPRHCRSAALDQGFAEARTPTGVVSVTVQVRRG